VAHYVCKSSTGEPGSTQPRPHLERPQVEGFQSNFGSAMQDYTWERDHGRIHTDPNPPVGALVFYGGGNGYDHVAVSIGGGQAIGTLGYVGQRQRCLSTRWSVT
jgi:hypothetical protein